MFSIFLGFSGGGGGGSSFFLGITYGPTSFCGPPASGGASCLFGLAGTCCELSCAAEVVTLVTSDRKIKINQINCLREGVPKSIFSIDVNQNMESPQKILC